MPFLRGDGKELLKIYCYFSKIFVSKIILPEQLKLLRKHPQIVRILVCSNHDLQGQGWSQLEGWWNF